ncbi:MAG: FAD-dependent oxidoreductase [Thermoleophilaceae bacterium]
MGRVLEADVAVVGAGLAGLVAARAVERAGRRALVLEARDRVGGRTLNADLGGGKVAELGGQWIGPTQDRVAALASELGVATFPTHTAGANLVEIGGRTRRYRGTIPRLPPHVLADVAVTRRRLNRLARRVPPGAPWQAPDAERLDTQTLGAWLGRHTRTRMARRLVALAGKTVWGAEPDELSLLHVLFYLRSAGGLDMLLDSEGGAQQDRLAGGSQLLSVKLADGLGEGVVLGAAVHRVEHGGGRVRVHADGVVAEARRVIVAVPPGLAGRIEYHPSLPAARGALHDHIPQGTLIKCMAVYDEPFWRGDGLSGEAVSDAGPATLTFDNSPPDGRPGVLLGFVGGGDARAFARLDAAERRSTVIEGFARLFGPLARSPRAWLEQSWAQEEWSGGGPNAYLPPGGWTSWGKALREPVGRLHWAGAEIAERWCGYLDGAVRSGERAAAEALEAGG